MIDEIDIDKDTGYFNADCKNVNQSDHQDAKQETNINITSKNPPIVTIGTVKSIKTFFFTFPALNRTTMYKKLKHSYSYLITTYNRIPPIVAIGTIKTVKTFFFTFPALNSFRMTKKLKYYNSYMIPTKIS